MRLRHINLSTLLEFVVHACIRTVPDSRVYEAIVVPSNVQAMNNNVFEIVVVARNCQILNNRALLGVRHEDSVVVARNDNIGDIVLDFNLVVVPVDDHIFTLVRDSYVLVVAGVIDDTRHLRHSWKAWLGKARDVEALRHTRNVKHVI